MASKRMPSRRRRTQAIKEIVMEGEMPPNRGVLPFGYDSRNDAFPKDYVALAAVCAAFVGEKFKSKPQYPASVNATALVQFRQHLAQANLKVIRLNQEGEEADVRPAYWALEDNFVRAIDGWFKDVETGEAVTFVCSKRDVEAWRAELAVGLIGSAVHAGLSPQLVTMILAVQRLGFGQANQPSKDDVEKEIVDVWNAHFHGKWTFQGKGQQITFDLPDRAKAYMATFCRWPDALQGSRRAGGSRAKGTSTGAAQRKSAKNAGKSVGTGVRQKKT